MAQNPETAPRVGKVSFFEQLRRIFQKILKAKIEEEEAKKAYKKMWQEETEEKIKHQKEKSKQEDEQRDYRERGAEKEIDDRQAYEEELKRLRRGDVKQVVQQAVEQRQRTSQGKWQYFDRVKYAAYLFEAFRDNPPALSQLMTLIDTSASAADILEKLALGDRTLHTNERELLRLGSILRYEAHKAQMPEAVAPIIAALSGQIKKIIEERIEYGRREAAARGQSRPGKTPSWLTEETLAMDLTEEQKNKLLDENRWPEVIDELLTQPPGEREARWLAEAGEPTLPEDLPPAPRPLQEGVDKIWREIEQREKGGRPLSSEELASKAREIHELKSQMYPTTVHPNTKGFRDVIASIDKYTEDRLEALAEILAQRVRQETPSRGAGGLTEQQFLERLGERPGYLGHLLPENPAIRDKLIDPKEVRFRNLVFLTILGPVLTQKNEPTQDTFGLYERADMTTFINTIGAGMAKLRREETRVPYGQTWVDWYQSLSNTIRNSRDVDYWANQPGADMRSYTGSVARFQNSFSVQALTFPAVEAAFRAYEATLRSIKDYNDGYIPPSMIDYNASKLGSYWDIMAQNFLVKMISQGVVKDVARDEKSGFHLTYGNGTTVKEGEPIDINLLGQEDLRDLELAMYMTLAKGFGMVSWHLLEKFARSKVPGSDHPQRGMAGFHSGPYEGVTRAADFMGMVVTKWRFGQERYFHLVNMLLPDKEKPRRWDIDEATKAYAAYRDGTFEEKYGAKAKRFIDLDNFTHFSANLPYSTWRHLDTTLGWSDKKREYIGGAAQIILAQRYTDEKIKDYLVVAKYREEFRDRMSKVGRPTSGAAFDKLWQEEGLKIYGGRIANEWDAWKGESLTGRNIPGGKARVDDLKEKYKRAFVARKWVEMAMKNPLGVAHVVEVEVPIRGYDEEKKKKMTLNSLVIQEVLGIPLRDLAYGEVPGSRSAAVGASPTEDQWHWMSEALDLETDIATVREIALSKNRELTEADFQVIANEKRRQHALRYWQIVRQVVLGTEELDAYQKLYENLGLPFDETGQYYQVDWEKIGKIDEILGGIKKDSTVYQLKKIDGQKVDLPFKLTRDWLDKEWDWQFASDDTSYRQMDMLNLGARQWVRRAGDAASHMAGGERLGQYLNDNLVGPAKAEDLAKALFEVRKAYEGDDIAWGWRNAGMWSYLTCKLYALHWSKFASAAQLHVFGGRKGVAAWNANERRKFWDTIKALGVLPSVSDAYYYNMPEYYNLKELKQMTKATDRDVWIEILVMGYLITLAFTLWRAFTAKSEEEEE